MSRQVPHAGPLCTLALLLPLGLVGCGGPGGECSGSVGSVAITGELGGETKLVVGGGTDVARQAAMFLDYADGELVIEALITLPAERGSTAIPFGKGAPPAQPGSGHVSRFRIYGPPEHSPPLRAGVVTVRQVDPFHVEGYFDLQFEDASSLYCTFDLSGRNSNLDDQLPDDGMFPTP